MIYLLDGLYFQESGFPSPASLSSFLSMPLPAQQPASVPSMATAGTDLTPNCRTRSVTAGSCIFNTVTSQEGQASSRTFFSAASHKGQPAEKISIFLRLLIHNLPVYPTAVSVLSLVYVNFNPCTILQGQALIHVLLIFCSPYCEGYSLLH